ncbi:MAG: 50S ribosome-binding protein YggL [Akkermansia sp.]|nr:50S ribosome-binding protein YggL [Akkermansia sp.]
MKKRLRKKFRVGEFQELCFEFSFEYKGDVESPECEKFLHSFVEECIEANDLNCEGCFADNGCNISARATDPKQTSEAQRAAVKAWLEAREDVELKSFGELEDAWYARG